MTGNILVPRTKSEFTPDVEFEQQLNVNDKVTGSLNKSMHFHEPRLKHTYLSILKSSDG